MGITIWSGLVLGAIYALLGAGFTLVQLPTGIFNFAQGAIVVGGCFIGYQLLSASSMPFVWVVVIDIAFGVIAGVLCEFLAVRPLRWRQGAVGSNSIITTVGASTAIVGAVGVRWGYQPLRVPFPGPTAYLHLFGVPEAPVEVILVCAAVVICCGLHILFRLTRRGHSFLAAAEDRDAAALRGINVNLLSLSVFALSGALGALSGILIGPITYAVPGLATSLALGGFVALALGGEGSLIGGLVGGLVVGLASTFSERYIGANYNNLMILAVLLVTLAVRPRGLSGLSEARHV